MRSASARLARSLVWTTVWATLAIALSAWGQSSTSNPASQRPRATPRLLPTQTQPRQQEPRKPTTATGDQSADRSAERKSTVLTPQERDVFRRSVYVLGDVSRPGPMPFDERLEPRDYLLLAGMDAKDAEEVYVQVLKPDGTMLPLMPKTELERGDTLIVMSAEAEGVPTTARPTPGAPPAAKPGEKPEPTKIAVPTTPDEQRGVRVIGAVVRGRSFPYDPRRTLDELIAATGGYDADADRDAVRVLRANGQLKRADEITHLLPGDTILVPRLPLEPEPADVAEPQPEQPIDDAAIDATVLARIVVTGAVARSMSFLYQPMLAVRDYIRLAGGTTEYADAERVRVLRRDGTFARSDEPLRAGDLIIVPTKRRTPTSETLDEQAMLLDAEEEARRQVFDESQQLVQRFGIDYFQGSRSYIKNLENQVRLLQEPRLDAEDAEGTETGRRRARSGSTETPSPIRQGLPPASAIIKDAISGFVGPTDLLDSNVLLSIPHNQVIQPGDQLIIISWSETAGKPPETVTLTVSKDGQVVLPPHGTLVVAGMTLEQFESAARDLIARTTFADTRVVATFERLRTIQVSIVGNAYRPGSYAISAAATLFNALYVSGGPSDSGSLRNITLRRGTKTHRVDFYRYLLHGDSEQDMKLEGGDEIWIGPVRRQVAAIGEFQRPAIYELADDEGFPELVEMALGIRPSGFAKTVQIESVDDHSQRVIRTLDATGNLADAPALFDGDRVTVYPVLSEPVDTIQVRGFVKQPRIYQFRAGMRATDAIQLAGGLRGEAHRDRADLFRRNADQRTTTLIPIDLNAALDGNPDANVPLQPHDRLTVYSTFEVSWHPERIAAAQGAVTRPGNYPRSDDMRLSDLLRLAGGALPDGYAQHALLLRVDARNRLARSLPVDLTKLTPETDLRVQDGDVLLVLTHDEARWQPHLEVRVTGAVQTPGLVPFAENMRVSDALFRAGGVLPDHAPLGLLLRKEARWDRVGISRALDLAAILAGHAPADLPLQPEDELVIYHLKDARWEAPREVSVIGAVQKGDTFPRTENMRVSDLLMRAGGILPNAYLKRADLLRYMDDWERQRAIAVNLEAVLSGDESADIPLRDGDMLRVATIREAEYVPEDVISIFGAVQNPDVYPHTEGMRVQDALYVAGGVLPNAREEGQIARARTDKQTNVVWVNLAKAAAGDPQHNIELEPGDVLSVMSRTLFRDVPRMVTITGEVMYPGTYAIELDDRISDLVRKAGGLTQLGNAEGAVFTRASENIANQTQRQALKDLWKTLDATNELAFERALARARFEAQKQGAQIEPLTETLEQVATPLVGAFAGIAPGLTGATENGTESGTDGATTSETGGSVVVTGDATSEAAKMKSTLPTSAASPSAIPKVVNLVTPARKIEELIESDRVVIDLPGILRSPRGADDLYLRQLDHLEIPRRLATVVVAGAAARPGTFTFNPKLEIKHYLAFAGGLAADADKDGIHVLRTNGLVFRVDEVERLREGDIIVVPTRVMVEKMTNAWDRIASIIRFTVATAATTVLVIAIVNRN
ncbi:hypothetical protein FJZ36_02385 [Candidatus Poribacteria bacterium]|nr:hypothetical protein [Candidatus Poribacteria bacterium]